MIDVLVVGYGSIGKRHVKNFLDIGIRPYVVTNYPDGADACFFSTITDIPSVEYAVIASPTIRHLDDFEAACKLGCKKILIEKPVEMNMRRAEKIKELAAKYGVVAYCAYNLRFLDAFNEIKRIVQRNMSEIRLVKIVSGQYLPEWRPYRDYRDSYSAHRDQGGGVDLDISHELDYMLWIFGSPLNIEWVMADKISRLDIDSPDYFQGIYRYKTFSVNVELDYIRKKERTLRIIGENRCILNVDFIEKKTQSDDLIQIGDDCFDMDLSYRKELEVFLGTGNGNNLATLDDGIDTLKLLGVG